MEKLTPLQKRLLTWSSSAEGVAFYAEEKARVEKLKRLGLITVRTERDGHQVAHATQAGLDLLKVGR